MARLLFTLVSVCLTAVIAENSFISPPEATAAVAASKHPVYSVGDTLAITWTDNFTQVDLIINQVNSPDDEIDYLPSSTKLTGQSYNWLIAIDGTNGNPNFNLSFSNQFNFILFRSGATSPFATSTNFNITNATIGANGLLRPTPTSVLSSSTSSASSTSSTSLSSSATRTNNPTTSATQSVSPSSTGLSTGAKAGIGVGVALGVLGVLLAGFAIFWVRRRKTTPEQDGPPPTWSSPDPSAPTTYSAGLGAYAPGSTKYAYESVPPEPPQELNGNHEPQELHNQDRQNRYELQ